jgi:hypothetical protein
MTPADHVGLSQPYSYLMVWKLLSMTTPQFANLFRATQQSFHDRKNSICSSKVRQATASNRDMRLPAESALAPGNPHVEPRP